jgi:hypothetical protein
LLSYINSRFLLILGFFLIFSTQASALEDDEAVPTEKVEPTFPPIATKIIEGSYIVTFKDRNDFEHSIITPPNAAKKGEVPVGKPTSGQSEEEIVAALNLKGKIVAILEVNNGIIVQMSAKEAHRLLSDPRVQSVEPSLEGSWMVTQTNPGWGLDRVDEASVVLDNTYTYTSNGAGRTIYILDSGLTLSNATVAAEFGGRASVLYDWNGGNGADTIGHGTMVASAAAGNTKGIARGATVVVGKISNNATGAPVFDAIIIALDWIAANAPRGSIVNISSGFFNPGCGSPTLHIPLETAIKNAHNVGIIVVVSAGNDSCNTGNYTPTRIPEAFVVGATNNLRISLGQDAKASFSRTGANISTFAPGEAVRLMNQSGATVTANGTSFSAPYIAGIFAIACQAAGTLCNTAPTAASLYTALRNTGTLGTVTNTNGTPLTGATSRFIRQQW